MDFYEELQKRVDAEASDKDEYLELAKIAPTEKAKKDSYRYFGRRKKNA